MTVKTFRSNFEKTVGQLLRKAKLKFGYETVKVSYIIEAEYTPDFVIPQHNIYIETKGYFKAEDRRKMVAVKKSNPDLDIRMWFMKDNYLNKKSKTKYSDWCKKHGFQYHIGKTLPKEWFKK